MQFGIRLSGVVATAIVMCSPGHASLLQGKAVRPPPAATSPNAAAATVSSFHEALRLSDLAAAAGLLSNEVVIYESGGVERGRAEYVSHHLPADAAFAKATTRIVTQQSANLSGDLAWIATESRTRGMFKGRAIDNGSTETMVLRRDGGTWKIIHIHWSSGK